MIKDRINKKVLKNLMYQEMNTMVWNHNYVDLPASEELDQIIDKYLTMVDGETIQELQKQLGIILTTSKHLLPFDKRELIWFQQSLGRLKSVRSGIKN